MVLNYIDFNLRKVGEIVSDELMYAFCVEWKCGLINNEA